MKQKSQQSKSKITFVAQNEHTEIQKDLNETKCQQSNAKLTYMIQNIHKKMKNY